MNVAVGNSRNVSDGRVAQEFVELRFVAIPDAPPAPSIAPQDVIGRHWKDVILPELPADFAVALEETMARHGPLAATLPRRTPGGETRHLELKGRPMFDAEGHFSGYRGIGREVTERARLAELRLGDILVHGLSYRTAARRSQP